MTNENNQDNQEDEAYENISKSERRILTGKSDPEIRSMCEKIDQGRLIINPEFQRFYVWESKPIIKSIPFKHGSSKRSSIYPTFIVLLQKRNPTNMV